MASQEVTLSAAAEVAAGNAVVGMVSGIVFLSPPPSYLYPACCVYSAGNILLVDFSPPYLSTMSKLEYNSYTAGVGANIKNKVYSWALATGTAVYFKVYGYKPNQPPRGRTIFRGSCGIIGSGEACELNTTNIVKDKRVTLHELKFTLGI